MYSIGECPCCATGRQVIYLQELDFHGYLGIMT